jgi:hypothetical protein
VLQIDTTDPNAGERAASATRNEDREVLRDGLEAMAGMARGDMLRIVSTPDLVFQRLALELSGYYLLGFEPQPGDRDTRPHKIKIDVRRRDVEVHARREFSVPATTAPTSEHLLLDALRSPLLIPDIGLTLTTYVFRDPESPRLKLILAADVDRSANPDGQYSLAYVVVDSNGKPVANQLEKTLKTPVRPDTHRQTYVGAAFAAPGSYTVKLAVVDDTGRRGSIERSVSAKLNAFGSIQTTELLIADNSGPAVGGLTPTVDARFTGDEVDGYLEMFVDAADAFKGATATIEVAETESSRALVGSPASIDARDHRAVVQGNVPIGVLPAGDYVLRASISVGGREAGVVSRPFHIARAALTAAAPAKPAPPKAAPMPSVNARTDGFDKTSVLSPHVVGFFLDRMSTSAAPAASLRPAIENARAGKFADITQALGSARDDQLAVPFLQGLVLLSRGELDPAANKFRDALRIDSEFLPAAFYLGACYAAGGKDREAVSAWQMSLVTETNAPFIYTLLGDALLRLRDFDQAIGVLTEADTSFPDNDDIHGRLTTTLFTALRAIHDAHAAGRSLGKPDDDRARFARYADAYAAAKGPQLSVVEQWRKQMERK